MKVVSATKKYADTKLVKRCFKQKFPSKGARRVWRANATRTRIEDKIASSGNKPKSNKVTGAAKRKIRRAAYLATLKDTNESVQAE